MSTDLRVPPQSEESEVAVLGSVLIDNDALLQVSEFLKPEHFYFPNHALAYEVMLWLYENRSAIDMVTVSERLRQLKLLKKVGGRTFLSKLANEVPTSANVESYGQIIKSLSAKRELISAAAKISENAFNEKLESNELLDMAEQEIFSLTQRHIRNKPTAIKEILTASFDRLDELQKIGDGLRGIPSGFKGLDEMLAGMQNSNLVILAARPGVGKTAFALNIARYVSVEKQLPVCIFSLEMSKEELVDRLLVRQGLIDSWKLKTGRLSETDFGSLSEAMGVLAEAPLYIDDTPGLTVTELRTKARRMMAERDIRLILVDYLQLMRGYSRDNRVQEVSEISQGLKNLARELKIPILAAAQLSRAMEARGGKPRLSDLRESGCLVGDSQIVLSNGKKMKIKDLVGKSKFKVIGLTMEGKLKPVMVSKAFYSGKKLVYELTLKSGKKIEASGNHPFKKLFGWNRLDTLKVGDRVAVPRKLEVSGKKTVGQKLLDLKLSLNNDVVPKEVWSLIETKRKELDWSSRVFHQKMGWAYSGTQRFKSGISRKRLEKIAKTLGDINLESIAKSDIYWDEVVSIKKIGIRDVYDMTVPTVSSFVANDIIVHNSIEQDADVVMFLSRPDEEVRENVTCAIAKHRNGPVGEFNLYFNGKQISFFEVDQKRGE